MGNEPARVPIRELAADVERIMERVAKGESLIVVGQGGEDLAIVQPVRSRRGHRRKTAADMAAFRASAGGAGPTSTPTPSSRPPVEL